MNISNEGNEEASKFEFSEADVPPPLPPPFLSELNIVRWRYYEKKRIGSNCKSVIQNFISGARIRKLFMQEN